MAAAALPGMGGKCHRGHLCAKRANSTGSFLNDQPHGKGQGVSFILTGARHLNCEIAS